jgi:hypothetical protein
VGLSIAGRLMPHYPNFTPLAATALFASFFLGRRLAVLVPLSAMLVSDLFIGFYEWRIMLVVYAALTFPVLFGTFLKDRLRPGPITVSALASSIVFFVSTNFAVWLFGSMYGHGFRGLLECYAAAVPFFRYTLAGDLFWSATLFASYALVRYFARVMKNSPVLPWKAADAR